MIATDSSGALMASNEGEPISGALMQRQKWAWWWAGGVVALLLAFAYRLTILELFRTWSDDPNYSHGFLVIPISLFILWRRLNDMPWDGPQEEASRSWVGWVTLVLILGMRFFAYEWSMQWLENATLLPAIVCLVWTFGGASLMWRAWPALAFLIFMFPLPPDLNGMISLPLQRIAATGSYFFLQLAGFWATQQGNIIHLKTPRGMSPLDVALACNGLKMLMTLAATVTATVMLLDLPVWKRITILISAVPIAMISNIIRIFMTGCCYYYIDGDHAKEWAHDISGWMMMPLALLLVALELQVLSWLTPEKTKDEEEVADTKLILARLNTSTMSK